MIPEKATKLLEEITLDVEGLCPVAAERAEETLSSECFRSSAMI